MTIAVDFNRTMLSMLSPNKVKARNSSVGQTTTLWLTSTSILVSVASLLFNILK